jgi:hypothetical protein
MTHTVHLDRQGYVVEAFLNTRRETLDARKYPGTLMEVTGDVCAGWRWDGQRFVLPPPRVPPQSVRAERDRRIDGPFPERFRAQITALGGDNALSVSNYVASVMRVAESFGDDAPRDFKDDRHWPKVPALRDAQVPVRVHDVPSVSGPPVTVNIAPVINSTQAETKALVVHHEPVPPAQVAPAGDYGLDRSGPLYDHKVHLISFIRSEVDPKAPDDPAWKDQVGLLLLQHTAAQTLDELQKREAQVFAFIKGKNAA